jgi:hypothetical protein
VNISEFAFSTVKTGALAFRIRANALNRLGLIPYYKEDIMPNRDGTGPYGNGRPGRGMGNCFTPRRSNMNTPGTGITGTRGYANIGVSQFMDAIRYLINRKSIQRR